MALGSGPPAAHSEELECPAGLAASPRGHRHTQDRTQSALFTRVRCVHLSPLRSVIPQWWLDINHEAFTPQKLETLPIRAPPWPWEPVSDITSTPPHTQRDQDTTPTPLPLSPPAPVAARSSVGQHQLSGVPATSAPTPCAVGQVKPSPRACASPDQPLLLVSTRLLLAS